MGNDIDEGVGKCYCIIDHVIWDQYACYGYGKCLRKLVNFFLNIFLYMYTYNGSVDVCMLYAYVNTAVCVLVYVHCFL